MKILSDGDGGQMSLRIDSDESIIVFFADGGHEAFLAQIGDTDDEDQVASISAVEISIALIALADPYIRSLIEAKISEA